MHGLMCVYKHVCVCVYVCQRRVKAIPSAFMGRGQSVVCVCVWMNVCI